MTNDAILVPLKRFDIAKDRLRRAGALNVSGVARQLALGVVAACHPRKVIILSESSEISKFAKECGEESFESDAASLSDAVQRAYEALGHRFDWLFIVHGDLREPQGLGSYEPVDGITIVTDHHGTGTNVLILPTGLAFRFGYGPNSAEYHQREAKRLGVTSRLVTDSPWRFDVDEIDDLS
jgi:2-phospho-L-lactate guanylyltransferase (CobY/MobA/RfbA family)